MKMKSVDEQGYEEKVYHPEEISENPFPRPQQKIILSIQTDTRNKSDQDRHLNNSGPTANTKTLTKKEIDKEIQKLLKICKLTGMEAILIKKLGDMEKHTVNEIRVATKSEAVSQLKSTVKNKIEEHRWTIKVFRGSWDHPTKWQLQNLT